jgi:hypothetical protein
VQKPAEPKKKKEKRVMNIDEFVVKVQAEAPAESGDRQPASSLPQAGTLNSFV